MPYTGTIAGLEWDATNSSGHITIGSVASAPTDVTTLTYAAGCILRDRSTGDLWENTGTSTTPVWSRISKAGGSFVVNIYGATTASFMPNSPVRFTGTITNILVVNGDATKGTLIFSKNGTPFATIVKNGTAGATTGQATPVKYTSFVPGDVLSVQNVGASDGADIIIHFT